MLNFLTHPFSKTSPTQTAFILLTSQVFLGSSIVGSSIIGPSFIGPSIAGVEVAGIGFAGIGSRQAAIALDAPALVGQWRSPGDPQENRVDGIDPAIEKLTTEDPIPDTDNLLNEATSEQTTLPPHNPTPSNPNQLLHYGNPPQHLIDMLNQIDTAASNEDLDAVMAFYSPNLQHSDGLTHEDLETMLKNFWKNHDALAYSTQITEWEQTDAGFLTTTITTVTGQQALGPEWVRLEATIQSKQQMNDNVIVEQEILAEQSRIQIGEQPPTVQVSLPTRVAIGQPFYFDAIVLEPIGNSLLMGTAFSDTVSLNNYTLLPALELDVLGAGGLFKVGDAPLTPSYEWVSGLVIREDGMTGVTQRLQIVNLSDLQR